MVKLLQLSIKDEIEDEEATIEDYIDEKMSDWDAPSVHKMYSIAGQCLNEKKNRRPDIKMVCSLSDKRSVCVCACVWLQY